MVNTGGVSEAGRERGRYVFVLCEVGPDRLAVGPDAHAAPDAEEGGHDRVPHSLTLKTGD